MNTSLKSKTEKLGRSIESSFDSDNWVQISHPDRQRSDELLLGRYNEYTQILCFLMFHVFHEVFKTQRSDLKNYMKNRTKKISLFWYKTFEIHAFHNMPFMKLLETSCMHGLQIFSTKILLSFNSTFHKHFEYVIWLTQNNYHISKFPNSIVLERGS